MGVQTWTCTCVTCGFDWFKWTCCDAYVEKNLKKSWQLLWTGVCGVVCAPCRLLGGLCYIINPCDCSTSFDWKSGNVDICLCNEKQTWWPCLANCFECCMTDCIDC